MDYKCSKCKQVKPHRDFYERKPTPDNSRPVRYECIQCQTHRDRSKEAYARALKGCNEICYFCEWPIKKAYYPLDREPFCKQCVKQLGYRVCRICDTPKLSLMFPRRKFTCNDCLQVNDPGLG